MEKRFIYGFICKYQNSKTKIQYFHFFILEKNQSLKHRYMKQFRWKVTKSDLSTWVVPVGRIQNLYEIHKFCSYKCTYTIMDDLYAPHTKY